MIDKQFKCSSRGFLKLPAFLFLVGFFAAAGCGGDESSEVEIFSEERSEAVEEAKARITFPGNGGIMDAGVVGVVIDVEGFVLGAQTESSRADEIANSGKGQHVHLIVNNEPYMAVYEEGEVELDLSPGLYTLLAFPSRSYHESVKNQEASDLINFCVRDPEAGCIERIWDIQADRKAIFYSIINWLRSIISDVQADRKAIFYSRPKGKYSGADAEKIMLDFYLHNLELSQDGYRVKYTVTKKDEQDKIYSIVLDEWKPAFITGLESGTYVVRLYLVDSNGDVVEPHVVAYNKTAREIEVVAE